MKIALISVHGDPVLQAGGKDAGGMNIYIRAVSYTHLTLPTKA